MIHFSRILTFWVALAIIIPLVPKPAFASNSSEALPQLAVLPLSAKRIDVETVRVLDDLLVALIHQRNQFTVLSQEEINSLIGFENMKDLMGCDAGSCIAEISGALGVSWVLGGSVGRLGSRILLSLHLTNPEEAKVISRSQATIKNDEDLFYAAMEKAVEELLARISSPSQAPATPEEQVEEAPLKPDTSELTVESKIPEDDSPSKLLEWSLLSAGLVSLGIGGYYDWEFKDAVERATSGDLGSQLAIAEGESARTAAWIGYGSGVALGVGALVMFLMPDSDDSNDASSAAFHILPTGTHGFVLSVGGAL